MADPPEVDGRRRDAIRSHLEAIAPYYTTEWDPMTQGPGTTLAALFSEMAEAVVERLDRVPEKHQRAFFDTLGFDRKPPHPATVPVSFTVDGGAPRNVIVDGGTRTVAPASNGRPEQTFTVPDEQRFEATPASLQAVYGVDPSVDRVCNHWAPAPDEGLAAGGDPQLFVDENEQRHVLYVGDADQLTVGQPDDEEELATIRVRLQTSTDQDLVESLYWQYYGEASVGSETVEQWHYANKISSVEADTDSGEVVFDLAFSGSLTETAVDGVESLWIRALVPSVHGREDLTDITLDPEVRVGPGPVWTGSGGSNDDGNDGEGSPTTKKILPDRLLFDDVPLPFDESDAGNDDQVADEGTYYPLGTEPQRQSTFYVASSEAFSKSGSSLVLRFADLKLSNVPPMNNLSETLKTVLKKDNSTTDGDEYYSASEWVRTETAPQLSWEYWDGEGWTRIETLDDRTQNLTGGERVSFRVPDDLAKTTVAGHENHWIRCRLVGGSYGTWVATRDYPSSETHHIVFPPQFDYLTIEYGELAAPSAAAGPMLLTSIAEEAEAKMSALPSSPATQVRTENHLSYSDNLAATGSGQMRPFRPLPEAGQTLYFGFDGPLHDGPLTLFVDVADQSFPPDFFPRIRWEYCADPEGDEWVEIDVRDGTENLTERGIVRLVLSGESVPHERFGAERHWLRARLRDDQFETSRPEMQFYHLEFLGAEYATLPPESYVGAYQGGYVTLPPEYYEVEYQDEYVTRPPDYYEFDSQAEDVPADSDAYDFFTDGGYESAEPCGRTLLTEPPSGEPSREPPVVTDISPNTAWATNVRLLEQETLGSSDAEPAQSYSTVERPVLDETVWVDELGALSEGKREALRDAESPAVEVETAADGSLGAFWVAWTAVPDLLDSRPEDRHYTIDRTAGTVTFGNGTRGRVPPRGTDSIEIQYRTGGGPGGNVAVGAVAELQNSIQFVDGVSNPAPGTGGAAAESAESVLSRAPKRLRDRDRAVAAADYERIATDNARELARARCIPEMNRAGDHEPGWVTLLVVPDAQRPKPSPSTGLKTHVESEVAQRAPATVVASDRLVVRGPSYVGASVDTTLVAEGAGSVATLEETAAGAVAAFLHPLTGGEDGDGWGFGDLPTMSDLYAVLEGVEGVDHVADLSMTFTSNGGSATVREGEESPSVSADALVHSDGHDVTVRLGETDTRGREAER